MLREHKVAESAAVLRYSPGYCGWHVSGQKKLFELDNLVARDLPDEEPFTPIDFESFEKACLKASYIVPDAYFVAIDNNKYVGLSLLNKFKADKDLSNIESGINETGITHKPTKTPKSDLQQVKSKISIFVPILPCKISGAI